ncbi:protein asteroid [Nilaparvata lugens]|uniref:protein asteroid n=1 Tax=Nilaparvata lugens TaxID=108931 RepID=UPI00193DD664|nr:protein asteroid [Nilaparvata lugens]
MGVNGLTTFISNNRRFMETYRLHDTFVIIDGNSLSFQLFCKHGIKECLAFGGDYDRYAQHIEVFFRMLSKCNVKSVVVFDGGCEEKKLKTVLRRVKDRTSQLKRVLPTSRGTPRVFPRLMSRVFREVLLEIGVPIVQCDFEADQEIAALGIKYNCPILSFDSDYFISGVQYIPLPTIGHKAVPFRNQSQTTTSNQFFIYCKIFKVGNLLKCYRGLKISMLPLLSALIGNDYVDYSFFENFYSQLNIGESYPSDLRIARVLEWLSGFDSFDSALQSILRTKARSNQSFVSKKIEETIESYNCKFLTVEKYLPSICTDRLSKPDIFSMGRKQVHGNVQKMSQVKSAINFPDWLLNNCRKGLVNSTVIDILTLETCISKPQVEDLSLKPCHEVGIPLIRALIKIIHGERKVTVNYWARKENTTIENYCLEPLNIDIPNLENLLDLSLEYKRSILLRLLNVPADFNTDIFPEEWKLYLCTILYWMKNTTIPLIIEAHVEALILCLIALNIIDGNLGFIRNWSQFLRSYGVKLNSQTISPMKSYHKFRDILFDVDELDCIAWFESLFKFHSLNKDLKSDPSLFSSSTIHAFAQFQICLHYSMMINAILNFPFKQCIIHRLFSGTFIYNVFSTLVGNAEKVFQELLGKSPKLFEVFKTLVSEILECKSAAASPMAAPSKKSRKKRKGKGNKKINQLNK